MDQRPADVYRTSSGVGNLRGYLQPEPCCKGRVLDSIDRQPDESGGQEEEDVACVCVWVFVVEKDVEVCSKGNTSTQEVE